MLILRKFTILFTKFQLDSRWVTYVINGTTDWTPSRSPRTFPCLSSRCLGTDKRQLKPVCLQVLYWLSAYCVQEIKIIYHDHELLIPHPGNYSRLACEIQFVRSKGYYLIQVRDSELRQGAILAQVVSLFQRSQSSGWYLIFTSNKNKKKIFKKHYNPN